MTIDTTKKNCFGKGSFLKKSHDLGIFFHGLMNITPVEGAEPAEGGTPASPDESGKLAGNSWTLG